MTLLVISLFFVKFDSNCLLPHEDAWTLNLESIPHNLDQHTMTTLHRILLTGLTLLLASCNKSTEVIELPGPLNPEYYPHIESIGTPSAAGAVYDEELVIRGRNFGNKKSKLSVTFDNIQVDELIEASDKVIKLKAPRIEREVVNVKVAYDGHASKAFPLQYDVRKCDSLVLFEGASVKTIRKGITWVSTIKEWRGAPRSLNVLYVDLKEDNYLGLTCPSAYATTSSQCTAADAIVGINGQYFGDNKPRDYLKFKGDVLNKGASNRSAIYAGGAFVMNGKKAEIKKVNGNEGAARLSDETVMVCGPLLIDDGKFETMLGGTHNTETHPRTAIGVTKDGRLILATIDGRFPGQAVGMPTDLMQEYMSILGAHEALNLDGGGSTTMWIKGKGIVNHACDGRNWEKPQERKVSSVVYIK